MLDSLLDCFQAAHAGAPLFYDGELRVYIHLILFLWFSHTCLVGSSMDVPDDADEEKKKEVICSCSLSLSRLIPVTSIDEQDSSCIVPERRTKELHLSLLLFLLPSFHSFILSRSPGGRTMMSSMIFFPLSPRHRVAY